MRKLPFLITLAATAASLASGPASAAEAEPRPAVQLPSVNEDVDPSITDAQLQTAAESALRRALVGEQVPDAPIPPGFSDQGRTEEQFEESYTAPIGVTAERAPVRCRVVGKIFYRKATALGVGTYFNYRVAAGYGCNASIAACATTFTMAAGVPPIGSDVSSGLRIDQIPSCSNLTSPSHTGPIPNLAVISRSALTVGGPAAFAPLVDLVQ
jgi:hypothetical protein